MKIELMGDPHLGRRFKTGTPLHRLGDREEMVWKDFEASLQQPADMHICLGDLFDKFVVPVAVVLRAADLYIAAAEENLNTRFVVLRGNHDVSRDSALKSSFDIFTRLVGDLVTVIDEPTVIGDLGFIPYDAFTSAEDQVRQLPDGLTTVFMHHDVVDFGGEHVIPTKLLAEKGILHVVNGHDHLARQVVRDGVTIDIHGSLQPYSHAEDPDGRLYRTIELPITEDVSMLNVRVLLREGETLPADLDCLSLTAKRIEAEDITVDTTEFETFDIPGMLASVLDGLSIKDELMERFHAA